MAGNDFEFAFTIAGNLAGSFTSAFQRAGDELETSQERVEQLRGQLRRLEDGFEAGGMSAQEFAQRNRALSQALDGESQTFNELRGNLQASGATVQELRQRMQVLVASYRAGGMSAQEFARRQEELSGAVRREIQQQTVLRNQMQQSRQRTQTLRQETRQLGAAYRAGESAAQRYEQQHRRLSESLEEEIGRQERLRDQVQAGNRTFGALAGMAAPYLGWGAVAMAAGAGVMALASGMDNLQVALSAVEQGTGATQSEMAEFRDTMLDIYGAGVGNDFADIGASLKTAKQITGQTGEELKNVAKGALLIRDAFDIDVTESTRAADSLMKKFGISAEEAYTLIAQGAQNGANRNGDLADTLNEYAVQFQQLGFTADQFTDVLVAGAQNGAFSIDKVGDALKEFNIKVKDGSTSTADGFTAIGLNADEMAQAFAAGGESAQGALHKTMDALMSLEDPVARNQAGVNLFGTMWEDLGEEGVRALLKISGKVDMTADTLKKLEVSRISSLGQAFDLMGRQIESAFLGPLSTAVLPIMKEFAGFLIDNAAAIKTYAVPAIAGLAVALGGVALAFAGPAIAAIGGFLASVGWIPVAIGGVAAAAVALMQHWDDVAPFFSGLWDTIVSTFQSVWGAMQPVFAQLQTTFQEAFVQIGTAFDGFIATIGPLAEALAPIFAPIAMFIGGAFVGAFIVAFDVIAGVLQTSIGVGAAFVSGLIDILQGITTFVTGVFTGDWSRAWEGVVQIFTSIFGGIKDIAGKVLEGVKGTVNSVIDGIKSVAGFGGAGSEGADISHNAEGGIYRQGAFLTTFAENAPEAAIPLDGSPRAISLWQQAGAMLGMLPESDAAGLPEDSQSAQGFPTFSFTSLRTAGAGGAEPAVPLPELVPLPFITPAVPEETGAPISEFTPEKSDGFSSNSSKALQGLGLFERAAAHFGGKTDAAGGESGAGKIELNLTLAPQINVTTAASAGAQAAGQSIAEQVLDILRREAPGILSDIAHEKLRLGYS